MRAACGAAVGKRFLFDSVGNDAGQSSIWTAPRNIQGRKARFLDALRREWQVLLYGCGLLIPVCSQICQWISYRQCANGAVSRWDEESPLRYTVRDNKKLRYAAFAAIYAAMLVAMLCLTDLDYRMPHMGRLPWRSLPTTIITI